MSTDRQLPAGLLLDLDDTILSYDAVGDAAWRLTCERYCDRCSLDAPTLDRSLREYREWYWSDPERNRQGRLRLDETRVWIIAHALQRLGIEEGGLAAEITSTFRELRDASIGFLPGAQETLEELTRRGVPLALVSNGQAELQRAKLERFDLERYFRAICIEGEMGFGKPDGRAFAAALAGLGLQPEEVWMVGDNLEWDIFGAQQAGIYAIWNDYRGGGLPPDSAIAPDRIVRRLAELVG